MALDCDNGVAKRLNGVCYEAVVMLKRCGAEAAGIRVRVSGARIRDAAMRMRAARSRAFRLSPRVVVSVASARQISVSSTDRRVIRRSSGVFASSPSYGGAFSRRRAWRLRAAPRVSPSRYAREPSRIAHHQCDRLWRLRRLWSFRDRGGGIFARCGALPAA